MKTTKDTKVREWYIATYPQDKLAQSLSPTITFDDVFNTLDGRKDVYKLFGVDDSLIREHIFAELAKVMEVGYDYIYDQWLQCEPDVEVYVAPPKIEEVCLLLTYITTDSFSCPVYKDQNGKLWKDVNMDEDNPGFNSACNNEIEGEPDVPMVVPYKIIVPGPDKKAKFLQSQYELLSRLQSDCDYFLRNGAGHPKHLWAGSVQEHINKMIELHNSFAEDAKPEWLTMVQILEYKAKLEG